MYNKNYERDPLVTHNPKLYYRSNRGSLVYSQMKEKIQAGRDVLCVTGVAGVGKSFLLQEIRAELATEITFINIPCLGHDFQGLIAQLCEDLGLNTGKEIILVALQSINRLLEEQKQINPHIAVIMDDAHQLQSGVIDKLMLLAVPPSDKSSSLQLIFSGLPELETSVIDAKLPRNEPSRVFCYKLETLETSEVGDFIKHDLDAGDYATIDLFTPAAILHIADYSKGIPRLIKAMCNSALSAIGAPESPRITEKLIDYVAKDQLLASGDAANETQAGKLDRHIAPKPKDAVFITAKDTLFLAKSEDCDNIDELENQQLIKRSALYREDTGYKSDLPLGVAVDSSYTEIEEDGLQATMNIKKKLPLAWGFVLLLVLGAAITAYVSNIPPSNITPPTANLEEEFVDQEVLPADTTEQTSLRDKAFQVIASQTEKLKTESGQNSNPILNDGPGSAARTYIADLEKSGQAVDLDIVYDYAELLSKENKPVDTYLLDFYAAKRGHGNAAFRLAQMADPATFAQGSKMMMFNKANITQANKWYSQAALVGHPQAERFLQQMRARVINKAAAGDEDAQRLVMQFQTSNNMLP